MNINYNIGKINRLNKIMNINTKRTVIVPLDHSVTHGPINGLNNINNLIKQIESGGANAIIGHRNIFYNIESVKNSNISRILHLSASTTINDKINDKRIISSVIDAIKLGAMGVSIQVNISSKINNDFLNQLGLISSQCYEWGIPLIVMAYVDTDNQNKDIFHITRICSDLGADLIKIQYPKLESSFSKIIEMSEVPIIIAGGEYNLSEDQLLSKIYNSISFGGSGVAIGRNIFQSINPELTIKKIVKIVHENYTVKEAMKLI